MSITNKELKTGIPFPLKEFTCNYVAFKKGNQVIKRVKFTIKDDMIDNPDIFHIEHPVLFGSQGHQDSGSKSSPILGVSHQESYQAGSDVGI